MRVALRTVFGWRLARGIAFWGDASREASPQKVRGVTPTPARSHPENGGMAPHQFFENNYFSEANQLRVLTVHEGHMGHYHHWRTDDSSSSCFCAIVNVGKMRGVTPTDANYFPNECFPLNVPTFLLMCSITYFWLLCRECKLFLLSMLLLCFSNDLVTIPIF